VNPRYIHPILTFPLPPMVIRQWGEEITHSDLPFQSPEEMFQEMQGEQPGVDEPEPAEGEEGEVDIFARDVERREEARRQSGAGWGGAELGGRMWGPEGAEMGRGSVLPRMGYGREGAEMMGGGGLGSQGEIVLPTYNWDGQTKFVLFRYFDSRVQPGSSYRYRVRLVLADVNAKQQESLLDPKVNERKKTNNSGYFFTEWSEPSAVATVPQPGLVFVKGADISANPNVAESEAELLIKSLNHDYAAEIALQDFFTRGSVLNLKQQAQIIWSSRYDVEKQPESPPFEFYTGLALLDFDGGEKMTNKELEPVRVLLMDSSGRMMIENELEDVTPVSEFNSIIEADKAASRERREDDDRGGRGGRGRGRGRDG
jgi:hypothetical protein